MMIYKKSEKAKDLNLIAKVPVTGDELPEFFDEQACGICSMLCESLPKKTFNLLLGKIAHAIANISGD